MSKNEYIGDSWKQADHEAVRTAVGWYFYKHRLIEVTGDDAAAFLDNLCVNTIAKCKVGRAKYTAVLREDGSIFDDCVVFRLEDNKFWISTLYAPRLLDWMYDHEGTFDVEYDEVSDDWDMYAVQGPKSPMLMNAVLDTPVDDMKFFSICDNSIAGTPVKVSRAGFTGEKFGYEIYTAPENDTLVENMLRTKGAEFGAREVTEFQVMVLTLATEAGYNLMTDLRELNPLEAEPSIKIDWEKDFIGKDALMTLKDHPQRYSLVGFEVPDVNAHIECRNKGGAGSPIMKDGVEVGRVTKYTYGYTCGKCIGFAQIENRLAAIGDTVTVNGYNAVLTQKKWL